MSSDQASQQPSLNPETVEQTKRQIRGLVSEIAQLSKSELGPHEYYPAFLQRVVSALAAVGGAVWVLSETQRLQLAYQIKLSDTLLDPESEEAIRHLRLLEQTLRSRQPQLAPPLSGAAEEGSAGNPTHYLLVLAPLQSDRQVEGVVEIFQRPDSQPATQRGYLRFLQQMCELAGEWLKSRKLQHFTDRHSLWAQADHFARLVHESLDLRETAYTVANEGRRLIGCDRVSVAILRGHKCKVEAVSGQDTLENRSNIVAGLAKLATRVVATGEPLWYEGSTDDLPPQIENILEAYVDESHSRSIVVLPLRKPALRDAGQSESPTGEVSRDSADRELTGALIIEQIETDLPREVLAPRIDLVYEHTARAIANAADHSGIFLMPVWRALGRAKWIVQARTLPKTLAVTGLVLAIFVFLFAYPASFDLRANGTLEPVIKQDVFADIQGVVVEVNVKHGQEVRQGDLLALLRNPDLQVQYEQTLGDRRSARERFASLQQELNQANLSDGDRAKLAGEYSMLQRRMESLDKQILLLRQKLDQLQVLSPIDGRVITWEVDRLLKHRTVMPGQVLMTVANTDADWQLEVFMPENRMGHVNRRLQELRQQADAAGDAPELPATFILATDPGTNRHGVLQDVDPTTQLHEEEGHSVRLIIQPDPQEIDDIRAMQGSQTTKVELRPGATVKAELHCGTRPIGYVWIHEAIEWFQVHVLFKIF